MEKYIFGNKLGSGSYGSVRAAYNRESGDRVAIKTLRDSCASMKDMAQLPEIRALRKLAHPNIVECKECILEARTVHIVFELMPDGDLESLARSERWKLLSEEHFADITGQILRALAYIHSCGYLHRDIKPENILVAYPIARDKIFHAPIVKIADLGLACNLQETSSTRPLTSYVATRWYRAPEQILRIRIYGPAADMWALGTTLAEFFRKGKPLFPGKDEKDQLSRICAARGHPAVVGWRAGAKAANRYSQLLPMATTSPLPLRDVPEPLVQFLEDVLHVNPEARPTARDSLQYPFIQLLQMTNHDFVASNEHTELFLSTSVREPSLATAQQGSIHPRPIRDSSRAQQCPSSLNIPVHDRVSSMRPREVGRNLGVLTTSELKGRERQQPSRAKLSMGSHFHINTAAMAADANLVEKNNAYHKDCISKAQAVLSDPRVNRTIRRPAGSFDLRRRNKALPARGLLG